MAPGLRVGLADSGPSTVFRVGESVPPLIQPFLEHLGLWPAFLENGHCPSFCTLSAWGQPELLGNEFFLQAHNTGWRLDRARFDAWLADEAARRGAVSLMAKVKGLSQNPGSWTIECGSDGIYTARCLVDASGRTAALSRQAGLRTVNSDRLVACVMFFSESKAENRPGADAAVVEAFQHGWWYTAATPAGHRVVALMTDSDLVGRLGLLQTDSWMDRLNACRHVSALLGDSHPITPIKVWPAFSRYLEGDFPSGLIAVGDAISSFDPLSSQGILKALRSGIFAAYAICDHLLHADGGRGFSRYQRLMRREFLAYRETLGDYYRREQRWPESLFWQRRQL